jgi:hypothetical protein
MQRYTYKFVWKKADGTFETKYIEAPDRDTAIDDLEKTYKVNMKVNKIAMKRMSGGETS